VPLPQQPRPASLRVVALPSLGGAAPPPLPPQAFTTPPPRRDPPT
jgi:hypothetical protein